MEGKKVIMKITVQQLSELDLNEISENELNVLEKICKRVVNKAYWNKRKTKKLQQA